MKKLILTCLLVVGLNSLAQETSKTLHLYFHLGDYELTKQSKKSLDSLFRISSEGDLFITNISAYCDTTGSSEMNRILANNRLQTVYNYCTSNGEIVNSKNSFGEEYPLNKNVNNYRKWRRVDVTYIYAQAISVVEEEIPATNKFEKVNLDSLVSNTSDAIVLDIQFVPGQDVLLTGSENEIWKLYDFLSANQNAFAFIRGHVCCANDPFLSAARAYSVYTMLVQQGISPTRLKYAGFSNTMPRAEEVDEESRQLNRRVDVVFSKID
jgi:outer membrane protein OmpA-like peptidoglycan-associated protein